ncbi:hypothetical protein K3555_21600 (plasmid) [Leisingera sp. M527]|uniref:hypothetical protein n=1 Tax=Leisingera sp. M527 TaxID=2867014 RepID=UPI0021A617BE|nr:hypothetical protein [Leisingera sp. M527]UWQ35159.1 hypothetical protein K3555_21600 [Leisingera sp. M527]
MITLQNFITPEPGICTEQALYCHVQGPAGFSQSTGQYTLSRGACARFDTYFNLFSLGKWNSGCAFDTLFAELTGSGKAEIKITLAQPNRSWEVVYCDIVELAEDTPYQIDLSEFAGPGIEGVLYAEVLALGDEVTLTGGRFATAAVPDSLPQLAVSITTFQREQEVQTTVARLEGFLEEFEHSANIHVQVVDNGQSAGIAASEKVTPYPNRNLGGAGGFARGLLEAGKRGCSHCLFMDDDASFHMENIARAYMFLALARDPKAALAGAMINNTHKWCMWENGAWFDGSCRPLYNGLDLRSPGQVIDMEFSSARSAPETLYGGWWFFAFPIAQAARHPFPFFVRGDDISFSLANDFNIFTLNGVVSFQDDFTEKESAQTLYLDLRNHLIHHLVFDALERSPLGTAKIALRFMLRSLLRCKYDSAEAQLLAWQDVMQGPQFFDENIDMSARRADIKALIKDEAWQPAETLSTAERRRFSRLPRRLRHYLGLFTLNGHLVPFWKMIGDRMVLNIGERGLVFPAFGGARLTYLNTDGSKGYTVTHSKRRFFSLAWRMAKTLAAFRRDHSRLKAVYRSGYAEMASKPYWEKTLAPAADPVPAEA